MKQNVSYRLASITVIVLGYALGLAGVGCAGRFRAECPLHGGQEWRRYESSHFTLHTNVRPKTSRQTIEQLEWTRNALLLMWNENFNPATHVDVLMVQNRTQFEEFVPAGFAGKLVMGRQTPTMALFVNSFSGVTEQQKQIIAHEMTHYLSYFIFPAQPVWFSEGFAQFMQTVTTGLEENTVVFGQIQGGGFLNYIRSVEPLSLEELWKWNTYDLPRPTRDRLYASSFVWFHFLYNTHLDRFSRFWEKMASGIEPRNAWEQAFMGVDATSLLKQLKMYLRSGQYETLQYNLEMPAVSIQETPISAADVHLLRAKLIGIGSIQVDDETRKKIRRELQTALAIDPNHGEARAAMIMDESEPKKQLAAATKLMADFPGEPFSHWALITSLRNNKDATKLKTAIHQASRDAPDDPYFNAWLALNYAEAGQSARATLHIQRAVRFAPWNPEIIAHEAAVAARKGECNHARALSERARLSLSESGCPGAKVALKKFIAPYLKACKVTTLTTKINVPSDHQ